MPPINYRWTSPDGDNEFEMVHVPGTGQTPYRFGEPTAFIAITVPDFYIGVVPVTQPFWDHVMGEKNPAIHRGAQFPVENISWDALMASDGFLQRVNASPVADSLRAQCNRPLNFRLPTETEWEYTARGGAHWRDGFKYSGGDNIDAVAWYERRHGDWTQPVASKTSNQLGIYDMSGNVWEWCADTYTPNLDVIPRDGTAHNGPGDDRVLRGGCFHNWAMHCTVSKRYSITPDAHDGCIGFRLVFA